MSSLLPPPHGTTGWPWTVETPQLPATRADGSVWPRISIVTPSYNQGQFIEETIRSVLLQGYPDIEFMIVDGGSADGSIGIIRKYEGFLSFWISERDAGQSDAINKGLSRTTGSIVNWLNSDDFLAPNALRKIADAFSGEDETLGAVAGIGHKLDANHKIFYSPLPERINRELLLGGVESCNFMQPACFFRKSVWNKCGPIRTDLHYCMDYAFWLKISREYEFKVLKEDIAFINTHPMAKSVAERKRLFAEIAIVLASEPDGFPIARRVAMDLADGKLVPDLDPGIRMLVKKIPGKLAQKIRNLLRLSIRSSSERAGSPGVRELPQRIDRSHQGGANRLNERPGLVTKADPDFTRPVLSRSNLDRFIVRRAILDALREQIPTFQGFLLDVGCGRKPYRKLLLAPPSKVEKYVGLDLNDTRYSLDERPDVPWDGHTIPLPSASFDCAICTEVLIHCPDPEAVLRETARVLKPDGKLFFTVPFLWPIHDAPNDQYRFTPFALQRQLANAGFVDIGMKSFGGWDVSLAQMIGLWVCRRPMSRAVRAALSIVALPIVRMLISTDARPNIPADFTSTMMITGISGTAIKRPQ